MFESFILGLIQGIADWLPVSSEGMLVWAQVNIFDREVDVAALIQVALFFHLGSLLAVVVYFWKDVKELASIIINYKKNDDSNKRFLDFLIVSSLITGIFGLIVFYALSGLGEGLELTGRGITFVIGIMLLATSFFHFRAKNIGKKAISNLSIKDSVLLGFVQAFTVLPGFSRSGATVSVLLLRKFAEKDALKISFFMSIPVILAGNIVLNYNKFTPPTPEDALGFLTTFVAGILTIKALLALAEKLNFAWFTLFFGILVIISVVII